MGLKKGVLGGVIAGIVAGIVDNVVAYPLVLAGLMGITEPITMEEFPLSVSTVIASEFGAAIISGAILGAIYSRLHGSVPGRVVTKGLCYGFLVWVIKDITTAMFMLAGYRAYYMALDFVAIGLPMWLAYGAVLGAIYRSSD